MSARQPASHKRGPYNDQTPYNRFSPLPQIPYDPQSIKQNGRDSPEFQVEPGSHSTPSNGHHNGRSSPSHPRRHTSPPLKQNPTSRHESAEPKTRQAQKSYHARDVQEQNGFHSEDETSNPRSSQKQNTNSRTDPDRTPHTSRQRQEHNDLSESWGSGHAPQYNKSKHTADPDSPSKSKAPSAAQVPNPHVSKSPPPLAESSKRFAGGNKYDSRVETYTNHTNEDSGIAGLTPEDHYRENNYDDVLDRYV